MTFAEALQAVRHRIVLVLIVAAVVAGLGYAAGSSWPKTYTSQAQILLGLDIKGSDIDPQTANLYLKDRVATYAELVTADEVIDPVADDANVSPQLLRERVVASIVPETVVLELSVSADNQDQAVALTRAVSQRFRSEVSSFNVETGGPKILPAQLSSPQRASAPDQLHGSMLLAVSALAGLVLGVLVALSRALMGSGARREQTAPAADANVARPARPLDGAGLNGSIVNEAGPRRVSPSRAARPAPARSGSGRSDGEPSDGDKPSQVKIPTWD